MTLNENGTITQNSIYELFGKEIPLMDGANSRLGFSSKEKDIETSLGDFDVRKYDEEIGRFTSIDPLWEKYLGYTPYHYCGNNPMMATDGNGKDPGDIFDSPDDCAKDFSNLYNGISIQSCKEYGTKIYSKSVNGTIKYSYVVPNEGENDRIKYPEIPEGTELVATAHTHGCYELGYLNNSFSGQDLSNAQVRGVDNYVATPNGTLFKYSVNYRIITSMTENIPSDNNDPQRKNNITPLPKFLEKISVIMKTVKFYLKEIFKYEK